MSFDRSMGGGDKECRPEVFSSDDRLRYDKLRFVYERESVSQRVSSVRIPKVVHQIWIGPKEPPQYLFSCQQKLKELHPDWEYHLWSDAELEEVHLEDWDLVERSSNFGEKADIIRANLLDRFGGVCLDADVQLCCPLDGLVDTLDFFAGLECPRPFVGTQNQLWVGVAVIGAKPGHPIIKEWRRRIRHGWDEVDQWFTTPIERVMNRTFYPFTRAVLQEIQRDENVDIVFPATYFYPISQEHARGSKGGLVEALRNGMYRLLECLKVRKAPPFSRIRPETMAIHFWEGEWQKDHVEMVSDLMKMTDWTRKDLTRLSEKIEQLDQRLRRHEERLERGVDQCE